MLSPQARSVWAKSRTSPDDRSTVVEWLPLQQHLDDSADIAGLLWDEWVPTNIRDLLAGPYYGDHNTAKALFQFLAGTHDVGKASPAFAVQVHSLADRMTAAGLPVNHALADTPDRRLARHETVSLFALRRWFKQQNTAGMQTEVIHQLASVVGAHHGSAPSATTLRGAEPRTDLVGSGAWEDVRDEFIERAAERTGFNAYHERILSQPLPQPSLVLLSALVIVADWIASNDEYFPLFPVHTLPPVNQPERVHNAWRLLDMPTRWTPELPEGGPAQFFAQRFDLPAGARPNAVQAEAMRLAMASAGPRLMIIESGMGTGKTEAALAAAEILAHQTGANGVFIGLPTQATTDSMFARVLSWAETLDAESSVFLAHSKSALNPAFHRMQVRAYFRSIGVDQDDPCQQELEWRRKNDDVIAHRWLSDRKRGPLANLVIGTIDQALFAALSSKHVMLRHLALASKVVVIDEAHAYDTFMSQFLDRTLEWLGAYGTSVIILSATLPSERRIEMLKAYEDGRRQAEGIRLSRAERRMDRYAALRGDIGYPAIVATTDGEAPVVSAPEWTVPSTELRLELIGDSDAELVALLRDALSDGGCAAVIRNTVGRVQETARMLARAFPATEIIVAHSRFLAADRMAKDAELLDRFGSPRRSTGRPERSIVVASQVIEQSLDLDFDLMVSDLAPIDLLLQRSGRLHRHERGRDARPLKLRQPRFVLTGVDWEADPPAPDGSYSKIYHPHILLRTLAVLRDRSTIAVPDDLAPLVQRVYSNEPIGPEGWQAALADAAQNFTETSAQKAEQAKAFRVGEVAAPGDSLLGWADRSVGSIVEEERGRAAVRDTEETLEVLVLSRDVDGTLKTPLWAVDGGVEIPLDAVPEPRFARQILGYSLRLPQAICRHYELDCHIQELEYKHPLPQWHASYDLKGELLLIFDHNNTAKLGKHELFYSGETGLEVMNEHPRRNDGTRN